MSDTAFSALCDFPEPACAVVEQLLMRFEAQGAQLHPVQMSYNNYLDGDAAFSAACDFPEPTCVVVKHTNPCGAASRPDLLEAYRLAVRADPISAFGGIVAFNRRAWNPCTSCKSSEGMLMRVGYLAVLHVGCAGQPIGVPCAPTVFGPRRHHGHQQAPLGHQQLWWAFRKACW